MPFKLRLKKSKQQYNVASKSVYVITVELLDNAQLECTLTSESTGRDSGQGSNKNVRHMFDQGGEIGQRRTMLCVCW